MAVGIFIMVLEFYIPGVRSPGGKIPPGLHPSGSDQARCAGANQVAVWIQVILLCSFNQAVDHSAGLSTGRVLEKSRFFWPITKGFMLRSAPVFGELQPAIFRIAYR